MWSRFDKKIGYKNITENGLFRKLSKNYIILLVILTSFSIIFVSMVTPVVAIGELETLEKDTSSDAKKVNDDKNDVVVTTVSKDSDENDVVPDDKDTSTEVEKEDVGGADLPVDTDKKQEESKENIYELENATLKEQIIDAEKFESISEKNLGNISIGDKIKIIPENTEETGINSVVFTPSKDIKEVKLTVAKLKDKPEEIIENPTIDNQLIYMYLDIKLTSEDGYIEEDKIELMKFEFIVSKTWINENNINKETIYLMRYHDEWQNLTTTLVSEDDIYVYYESETPGLSTFAVVGGELIESSASYVEEVPEVPWILNIGIIASCSILLSIVLFKARYIYLDGEKNAKESKKKSGKK